MSGYSATDSRETFSRLHIRHENCGSPLPLDCRQSGNGRCASPISSLREGPSAFAPDRRLRRASALVYRRRSQPLPSPAKAVTGAAWTASCFGHNPPALPRRRFEGLQAPCRHSVESTAPSPHTRRYLQHQTKHPPRWETYAYARAYRRPHPLRMCRDRAAPQETGPCQRPHNAVYRPNFVSSSLKRLLRRA